MNSTDVNTPDLVDTSSHGKEDKVLTPNLLKFRRRQSSTTLSKTNSRSLNNTQKKLTVVHVKTKLKKKMTIIPLFILISQ